MDRGRGRKRDKCNHLATTVPKYSKTAKFFKCLPWSEMSPFGKNDPFKMFTMASTWIMKSSFQTNREIWASKLFQRTSNITVLLIITKGGSFKYERTAVTHGRISILTGFPITRRMHVFPGPPFVCAQNTIKAHFNTGPRKTELKDANLKNPITHPQSQAPWTLWSSQSVKPSASPTKPLVSSSARP